MERSNAQFKLQTAGGSAVDVAAPGLWIGSDPQGAIRASANRPDNAVAKIEFTGGAFYLADLSDDTVILLNGRSLETATPERIVSGDRIAIDETQMSVLIDGRRCELSIVSSAGRTDANQPKAIAVVDQDQASDMLREFWEKRSRDKIARPSALHPQEAPRPGKARFGWHPTRDLARPWPVAIFAWAAIVVVLLSVGAALIYARAYSPGPLSNPHQRREFERKTATTMIAARPNANSCTACHAFTGGMNAQCAACHQTAAFAAATTGIDAHARAGVGCTACHTEHRGGDFADVNVALNSCANCHRDGNTFGGHALKTPHGGTVGYPVRDGQWLWAGLTVEEWNAKSDGPATRVANETENDWRRRQFHTLHLNRISLGDSGLPGDNRGLVSCSSCHTSLDPVDKTTPVTTCAKCHNGNSGAAALNGQPIVSATAANCVSCHVQHARSPDHWNARLFKPRT